MARRLFNLLAALSLLLFVATAALYAAALFGRPWVVTHGTIAGGEGFVNAGHFMIFWAGDLTGVSSRTAMDEWSFPGLLFRRVRAPSGSVALFVAHWIVLLLTAATPAAWWMARWLRRRAGRAVGFDLSADAVAHKRAET